MNHSELPYTQLSVSKNGDDLELARLRTKLGNKSAGEIITWAAQRFAGKLVMSTSFGIYSAAALHLVLSVIPDIPVIWIDTGYLPAETYRYAENLQKLLNIRLHVYQSLLSPARMEALEGRLYESDDPADISRYHFLRKVEPMNRALQELEASAWIAGLRAEQTEFRRSLQVLEDHRGLVKIHPMLGWKEADLAEYHRIHSLPHHPLYSSGYRSVGDHHSSRPMAAGDSSVRATRFRGLVQECGLHLPG